MECLKLGGTQGKWVGKLFFVSFEEGKFFDEATSIFYQLTFTLSIQITVTVLMKPPFVSNSCWLDKVDLHIWRSDFIAGT